MPLTPRDTVSENFRVAEGGVGPGRAGAPGRRRCGATTAKIAVAAAATALPASAAAQLPVAKPSNRIASIPASATADASPPGRRARDPDCAAGTGWSRGEDVGSSITASGSCCCPVVQCSALPRSPLSGTAGARSKWPPPPAGSALIRKDRARIPWWLSGGKPRRRHAIDLAPRHAVRCHMLPPPCAAADRAGRPGQRDLNRVAARGRLSALHPGARRFRLPAMPP